MKIRNLKLTLLITILTVLTACKKEEEVVVIDTTPKAVFMTAQTYTGNLGGTAGADAKCMADSNYPGTGTYKAFIADSTRHACTTAGCTGGVSENKDWVLYPNRAYFRNGDKVNIGTTNTSGIFDFPLSNSFYTGHDFWTGMSTTWTANNHCTDWTISTATAASIGAGNATNNTAISGVSTCNVVTRIICIEQ